MKDFCRRHSAGSRTGWLEVWLITLAVATIFVSITPQEARGESGCRRDCPLSQRGPDGCCPQGPRRGQLEITSQPPGATVFLDGRLSAQAKTTPTTLSLRPKTYRIEVRLEGYEPSSGQVKVQSDRRHRLDLELTPLPGHLDLSSTPPGATILIDGRSQGEETLTPATLQLEPGEHIVELRLQGHESLSREISITPGGHLEILLGFTPEAESEPLPHVAASEAPESSEVSQQEPLPVEPSPRWRGWPWVLIGTGLGMAATGSVLYGVSFAQSRRTEPTNTFNEYLHWQSVVSSTALAGDILMGLGVAIAVGGLIWLLLNRRHNRQVERSASVVESYSFLLHHGGS